MDAAKVQRYLNNHKFVLYLIIGFLAFLTYLLIVVAQQVSDQQAFQTESQASERGFAARYARNLTMENDVIIDEESTGLDVVTGEEDIDSCDVTTTFYRKKYDVNGYRIVGCSTGVYCGSYAPSNYKGRVECAYTGTGQASTTFDDALCANNECQAKAETMCGCAKPTIDPLAPTDVPVPTEVPVTPAACIDTVEVINVSEQRDRSGKCGGISNTKQFVSITCRQADGSQTYCNLRDISNRCIDPSRIKDNVKKQACCGCSDQGYYTIDIDSDLF